MGDVDAVAGRAQSPAAQLEGTGAAAVFVAAWATLFQRGLVRRLAPWVLIGWALLGALYMLPEVANSGLGAVVWALNGALAVRWHRYFWAHEDPGSAGALIPRRRDLAYLIVVVLDGAIITLSLAPGLMGGLPGFVTLLLVICGAVAAVYVTTRMSLALPIVALGLPISIFASWRLMQGRMIGIILTALGIGLIMAIAHLVLVSPFKAASFPLSLVGPGVKLVIDLLSAALFAGVLTLTLRVVTAPGGEDAEPQDGAGRAS